MNKPNFRSFAENLNFMCLIVAVLAIVITPSSLYAASRNILPRTPELIIEKGFSGAFRVLSCVEKVKITAAMAQSSLKVVIKNASKKEISSTLKFRILYPRSTNTIKVKINGKAIRYNRKDPRYSFKLSAGATLNVSLSAKTGINFSIDALKKAMQKNLERQTSRKKKASNMKILQNFASVFSREHFGKRFLISSLVSKWGIFPIDFDQVKIEVSVPRDFTLVTKNKKSWIKKKKSSAIIYSFNGTDGFNGAVFLPENDVEHFLQWQKLSSKQ